MNLKNSYFKIAAFFAIIQQCAMAGSLHFLAQAGSHIAQGALSSAVNHLILFFSIALLAYLLNSVSEYYSLKMRNRLWQGYTEKLFSKMNWQQQYNSLDSRNKTLSWLVGEAPKTLSDASTNTVEAIALYTGIGFTLIVFASTLGLDVAALMSVSLIVSFLFIHICKTVIAKLAEEAQSSLLEVNKYFHIFWDIGFHTSSKQDLFNHSEKTLGQNYQRYFRATQHYEILEKVLSNFPVILSVLVLVFYLTQLNLSQSEIGAMIALLPRTLQFFASVHVATMINSRFVYLKKKLQNLATFEDSLKPLIFDFHHNKVRVIDLDTKKEFSCNALFQEIVTAKKLYGRVLVLGDNGTGKSTFLKAIKDINKQAFLLSPNTHFNEEEHRHSVGEAQKTKLDALIENPTPLMLLDEWDAHLDESSVRYYENRFEKLSKQCLIIEVRHRYKATYLPEMTHQACC